MVSEEAMAMRASGNTAWNSSATRSTPGPQAIRLAAAPQFGQWTGAGSL